MDIHFICWHFSNLVLFLFNQNGDVQVLDLAGNEFAVGLCTETPKLGSILSLKQVFRHNSSVITTVGSCHKVELSLIEAKNRSVQPHTKILVFLERGPFIMFDFITPKFTFKSLIRSQTGSSGKGFDGALRLLDKLNWNEDSELLFFSCSQILNKLLSRPISFTAEEVIENVLDLFYEPFTNNEIKDVIGEDYEHTFYHYSVKYIQMLMRTGKLEKALNLAIAVNSPDSCMVS